MINTRSNILRELVTEYKSYEESEQSKRNVVFSRILCRLDKLLISRVLKLKRIRRGLWHVDAQDLYQTAIVGLYRGINSAKDCDNGNRIQARILSYVNEEVRKTYLGRKRIMVTIDPQVISSMELCECVEFQIEGSEIIAKVLEMVEKQEVSRADFNMLIENSVNGKSYSEIGRKLGLHYTTVSKRIKKLREIILEKLKLTI